MGINLLILIRPDLFEPNNIRRYASFILFSIKQRISIL